VIFAKELPALPLYVPVYSYGVDAQVLGVQIGPLYEPSDRLNTFASWYLLTRRALGQETPSP
jgi:peptide/nickel transport system substrate-binding protein